jgi:hypothetical protein
MKFWLPEGQLEELHMLFIEASIMEAFDSSIPSTGFVVYGRGD